MPETIHPAVEAAYQLLGFIFEAEDLVEIRTLGTRPMQRWAKLHDLAQTLQQAADFPAGTHVYFGANPRARAGGKAEDVQQARCLFADFDHGCTLEQARLKWNDACIPEPTVIVATGGGIHAWWRLQEPMEDLARWTDYQDALAQRLGSDRSVTDAPRIMRMPGFVNWKYPERPTCTVLACEPDRAYGLEEFPDPAAFQKVEDKVPLQVAAGSLSDLSKRFLEDGYLLPGYGRRDTIFTVACDLKARQWAQADAEVAIMRRARLLGLGPDDLADLPRQIANAFKGERTPLQGKAEEAQVVVNLLSQALTPVSVATLCSSHVDMKPQIIHGLLREQETLNLISAPKMGKSWLVNDLAICLAAGTAWLGRFNTTACRVLIIDNELHSETSANRIPKVLDQKGLSIDNLCGRLDVLNLRGNLKSFDELDSDVFSTPEFEALNYRVIILDAFYRFNTGENASENDNAYMTGVYNKLDRWAARLKCAFVCVHHSSKGDQNDKEVTDVGSGAGSMARAADTHLILRHHQLDNHVVLDAAVRSFPKIEPMVLNFTWPVFVPSNASPEELRQRKNGAVEFDSEQLMESFPDPEVGQPDDMWFSSGMIIRAVRKRRKSLGVNKIRDAIRNAVEEGLLEVNGLPANGRGYRKPTLHGREGFVKGVKASDSGSTLHTHDHKEVVCGKGVNSSESSRP